MSDLISMNGKSSSGSAVQPAAEEKLVLGPNPAYNGHPIVRINGGEPCVSRMIDPMVFEIVLARPVRGTVTLDLGSPYLNSEIRYTTNGKNPTNTSKLYTEPLIFHQNATGGHTTLKARIYDRINSNLKGKIIRVAFRVIPPR